MTCLRSFWAPAAVALLGACAVPPDPSSAPVSGRAAALVGPASVSPSLASRLASLSDGESAGVVIVSFRTSGPLVPEHLSQLQSLGITSGITLPTLAMVAAPATAGQARALSAQSWVRSVWDNRRLGYLDHQTRTLAGVEKLRGSAAMAALNHGLPVTGRGVGLVINDSGIDARHDDLQLGSHVVQNVFIAADASTVQGFTPLLGVENVPDTDLNVGHGTHCAGIAGGSGQDSSGLYSGVAPGARLIGTGSGAALFVLNALGGLEWSLAHRDQYGIRVVSNSWGTNGPGFDPEDPINIATRKAHDDGDMVVVFAAGNSGPGKGTLNPYAKAPWVIAVAAGTKEGGLASFSSRGLPAGERTSADYNEAPTLTAPGTGREFDPAQSSISRRFTSAVISTRSATNLFANGGEADLELPLQYVPYYTQISGTSMATPFVAGVAALVLEANPSLTADQVKDVLVRTASHMPGYEDFEVGAGYVNAYAAVDLAFHPGKAYGSYSPPAFNESFTITGPPPAAVHVDYDPAALPGPGSANSRAFSVLPGMNVLDVLATIDNAVQTGDGNTVGLLLTDPTGAHFSSGIALPILDAPTREVVVKNPVPGTWLLEVRGVRGLAALPNFSLPTSGAAAPGPVDVTIRQQQFVLAPVADIQGHPLQSDIELALESRYMDTFPDGTFRPEASVTRGDLTGLLFLNTALRQSLADAPPFTDVSGSAEAMAEAVTAGGSTLRDWSFEPAGMVDATAPSFNPRSRSTRLQIAVALVRALGLDPDARALAGATVTANANGIPIPLDDNAQIPSALRGYVQLALDLGILQATVTPLPLPHATFNPSGTVTRAAMARSLARYREHFAAGF